MIWEAVSAEVCTRITGTIPGLNVFPFWVSKVPIPGITVGIPDEITFDQTYGRGLDHWSLPLILLVGKHTSEQAARDLGKYTDGSGPRSLKQALNAPGWTSCDDVVVKSVQPGTYSSGGVILLGAEFTVDVYGKGETS